MYILQEAFTSQQAHLFLDDGTSIISVVIPARMIQQVQLHVGDMAECIARVDDQILFVDQIVCVQDPHAEALRWLELIYRDQQNHTDDNSDNIQHCLGYPVAQPIKANDIFRLISAEAMVDSKEGMSLKDLVDILDLDTKQAEKMIEDLQLSGQIYRNEKGDYLPL